MDVAWQVGLLSILGGGDGFEPDTRGYLCWAG
jgi:hypothetical protein